MELIGKTVPFNDKLIFIDLETANSSNCICQIGAIVCDNGKVIKTVDTIVNPNAEFSHDCFHTGKHGIDENDVVSYPAFKEVWEESFNFYSPDFIFVGHNIKSADSTWLLQDLKRYGINLKCIYCYDTFEMAKKYIREDTYGNTDYKLNTLCKCLNIPYDRAHNAFADTLACFKLFWYILENHKVDLSLFRYCKSRSFTEQEWKALEELKKKLHAEKGKLKKLKEFRSAIKAQNNELAISLSEEYSVAFTDDVELYKLIVGIPDDAIYTKEEIALLTQAINQLQEKILELNKQIEEF